MNDKRRRTGEYTEEELGIDLPKLADVPPATEAGMQQQTWMFMGAVKEGLSHVTGMQKATIAEIREMARSMQTKEGCEAQRVLLKNVIGQDIKDAIEVSEEHISDAHEEQQIECQQGWATAVDRMSGAADKARKAAEDAETAAKLFRKNGKNGTNWTALGSLALALVVTVAALFMWWSNREVKRALTEESVKGLQQEVKELKDVIQEASKTGHSYLFQPRAPKTTLVSTQGEAG